TGARRGERLYNILFTISRSLFFQRKIRPDPAESNAAVPSTVLGGERETLSAAQKKLRPTPRKILLNSSLHKYRAMSECRSHQQHGAMQTRFASLRARPTAVRASPASACRPPPNSRSRVGEQIHGGQHSYRRKDQLLRSSPRPTPAPLIPSCGQSRLVETFSPPPKPGLQKGVVRLPNKSKGKREWSPTVENNRSGAAATEDKPALRSSLESHHLFPGRHNLRSPFRPEKPECDREVRPGPQPKAGQRT